MTTITEKQTDDHMILKNMIAFFKKYRISQHLKNSNAYKSKGVPIVQVFMYIMQLVFTKKSMYMNILNGTNVPCFGKDVIYRLLNSTYINWATFLISLAGAVIANISTLTNESRLNVLIVDDSVFERPRSKKVELLANIHDHAAKGKNKYKRGFRMLTLGWSDGVTFIPLLFRLLSSTNQKNRYNEITPDIDKRTVGYKTRQEAISKTTDVLFLMLERVKKMCIPAKHLLFDSWFSFPSTIMRINQIGFDVVARLKNTKTILYLYKGEKRTLKQIYDANKKRRGKAKYLLSVVVQLYNDEGNKLFARIVFVRDRNKSGKWIAFISTDMTLTEEEIMQLYARRWDIEVFFKICKSYLKLAKEFQGISYDSMTAHTTIVMTRYIMLAVHKRQNEDPRSLGELFHLCYDEIAEIQFSEALALVLTLIRDVLNECHFLSDMEINEIIDAFIEKLSSCFKLSLSTFEQAG